jgi:hypothetical protein
LTGGIVPLPDAAHQHAAQHNGKTGTITEARGAIPTPPARKARHGVFCYHNSPLGILWTFLMFLGTDEMPDKPNTSTDELPDEEGAVDVRDVVEQADPETEEYYPVEYSISSYGADYPVDGLVKRINDGAIFIPTFQRGYVWNIYRASRFIESLLLGLPVPAIFLSKDEKTQKLLVIDGQQRLRTLQYFYNGVFEPTGTAFRLRQVQSRYESQTYKTLREEDRLRLDDSILHAIIVKQEKPDEDQSSVYHIFERLNTGGVFLQPQEIRSCVYHGAFSQLLADLNSNSHWRAVFGGISTRMRDQELILRFFALYYNSDEYTKPMKEFLNRFMKRYRDIARAKAVEFQQIFEATARTIHQTLGPRAFKPTKAVNAALCDSVMVGIARRLSTGPINASDQLKAAYDELKSNTEFKSAIESATTDESSVRSRLRMATDIFSAVV